MDVNGYYDKGEEEYISGNYSKALFIFEIEMAHRPSSDCKNYIGCCHLALGDFFNAIKCFKELINSSPKWERPVFNLGRVYLKMGEFKKAIKYLNKALEVNDQSEDA